MIYAFICVKCAAYRYRTVDLPEGQSPMPEDFTQVTPQVTMPETGAKAVCDTCSGDLRLVKVPDEAALTRPLAASPLTNGHRPGRVSVAPPGGAICEVFKAESGEDVKDIRDLPGGRLLVVTSRRIVVVDPNLIGQEMERT